MKIWIRVHGYELCSWTFVWENLKDAFIDDGDEVHFLDEPPKEDGYIELWWGDPQFWQWSNYPAKARVSLALTEGHSILTHGRRNVIENIQKSDMLICPSEFASIGFLEAPIDIPIRVVKFGINQNEFQYAERNWGQNAKIGFLHGGATQFRKGSWLVPEAFVKAFKNNNNVTLTIASPKVTPMFTRLKLEYGSHPCIDFISEVQESASKLYNTHHIYVSPHLSEGFGLMIPEAMATGMACLTARCSAPREFFDSRYGWWIEMSETYMPVDQCLPDTMGFWRCPDLDSLVEVMKESYELRNEAMDKGKKASEYVLNNLTWSHTVRGIKKAIKEVLDVQ